MDYKYLLLRYQTFREEYLELSHKWFKSSWSWLWRFTLDNFRFLYLGEINQITLLKNTIRQQEEYIELIRSQATRTDPAYQALTWYKPVLSTIVFIVRICLIPASFLVYWIRRTLRMVLQRHYKLVVSVLPPISDMALEYEYRGETGSVYLAPDNRKDFPRGLVIFRYTLTVTDKCAAPVLFIDPGVGFTSEYSVPLPFTHNGPQQLLLELPPYCSMLELRVAANPVYIELKDVSLSEISLIQAARYLKAHHNFSIDEILHALFIRKLPGVRRILAHKLSYAEWNYKYVRLSKLDRKAISRHIATMIEPPTLSLLIHASNLDPDYLDQTIQSVHRQLYPHWELLVTCAGPADAHITMILNRYERYDARIKIIISTDPAGISHHISDAVTAATGACTGIINQGDLLTEHALYLVACKLYEQPQASLLYSDHDHIDEHGRLSDPCLKPDWNYDFQLGKNYLQHIVFYNSKELVQVITGQVPQIEPYRLNLQFIERTAAANIVHIPYVLLHHRKPGTVQGETASGPMVQDQTALEEHLSRTGQSALVLPDRAGFRIKRTVPTPQPLVSLIVLTRDRVALLSNCINGLLENTAYANLEVIIIDNGSVEASTLTYLEAIGRDRRVSVYKRPGDFNFSDLNNFAVEHAQGEFLGLVNNDISVINSDWLDEMMGHLVRPDVGIVGAKLLYDNRTIQHAGVIIGLGGVAGHGFRHAPGNYRGYDDRLALCQQLSCVTAACLLTKKGIYKEVGGLDDINLRIAFNDVDYCLKVREQGWKIIWTPFAELYHLESASRGSDLSKENINRWKSEYNFMRNKWRPVLDYDPFYNPNLGIADEEFALAQPPRLVHPWTRYIYSHSVDTV